MKRIMMILIFSVIGAQAIDSHCKLILILLSENDLDLKAATF